MGLILATNKATGLEECFESSTIRRIVTDRESAGSIIYTHSYLPNRGRIFVNEDLSNLFAQQDTALLDLGMVLVTLRSNSEQIILFSHNFDDKGVVDLKENGVSVGSKVIQKDSLPDFEVEEPLSVIYGYQKAGVSLGFINITRKSDGEAMLLMDHRIKYIKEDQVTGDAVVNFYNDTEMVVNESLGAIYSSQSA